MLLILRTDKPEAELGIFDGTTKLSYKKWEAHRELSDTIHKRIAAILQEQDKELTDIDGIVCYKGPGSFTGLRIGMSVANTLASGLSVPLVTTTGEDWIEEGIEQLQSGKNEQIGVPEYGGNAHITMPRK